MTPERRHRCRQDPDRAGRLARRDWRPRVMLARRRTVSVPPPPLSSSRSARQYKIAQAHVKVCLYDRSRVEPMEMHSGPPVRVGAFVGRERELAKLADLVADVCIVTLT